LLLAGSGVGVTFSAYLTYVEAFVINAWCQWCVISAVLITLIFLASIPEVGRLLRPTEQMHTAAVKAGAGAVSSA
jgi:uncharacterized membrane protein